MAVARCPDYGSALLPALERICDQIGGLGALVKGKTVAIKLNLTGNPTYRLGYHELGVSHYTHPRVITALVHLLARAGARRIRLLESPWSTAQPLEEYMLRANWSRTISSPRARAWNAKTPTGWAAASATCASRSPTGATSSKPST